MQQRKQLKQKQPNIHDLITKCLIPNIVMQYNLRQQIQSQNMLKDYQNIDNSDEVLRLEREL